MPKVRYYRFQKSFDKTEAELFKILGDKQGRGTRNERYTWAKLNNKEVEQASSILWGLILFGIVLP